jgi:CHAT domain-containing protein
LRWPRSQDSLLDTSAVSLVRPGSVQTVPSQTSDSLHVIVASQQLTSEPSISRLEMADVEPLQIERVVSDRTVVVTRGQSVTPDGVLATLSEPGAWVHVAAHGSAKPGRLGYAGVWLDPPKDNAKPVFLSWLDILQHDARAELVVLNACQLGDSGDAINGNLSFASAVSEAGATQVVASLWPVSDAATAIWVPAFYTALESDPRHRAAEATRAAQIKLRDTRIFRHPFYWAGCKRSRESRCLQLSQCDLPSRLRGMWHVVGASLLRPHK